LLQEVAVRGQDVAFKDVIEPLESVSVSIIKTDKTSLSELGTPDEVMSFYSQLVMHLHSLDCEACRCIDTELVHR
jgi:photosystem II oxygen-evolving enhancer protein 2